MENFLSLSIFKGRLPRLPYALIAIPIHIILYSRIVGLEMPLLLSNAGFKGADFHQALSYTYIFCNLMIIPLMIAAINRLRDAELTPWLSVPLILPVFLSLFIKLMISNNVPPFLPFSFMFWLNNGVKWSAVLIGLGLILVPGRKNPTVAVSAL